MVKYIRFSFVGILLFMGVLLDFAAEENKPKKGIYYDHIQYSDNVVFNRLDGLEIDYSAELTNPGDSYHLDFDVVNDSNVDMKIENLIYPENDSYISYQLKYQNGSVIQPGDIIKKGESVGISYVVSYDHLIDQDEYLFDSSFHIQYEQVI